jgi:hypothetical protein
VSVTVTGEANAHKLFIETYGDDEIGTMEISRDGEGAFAQTFGVAFTYGGDLFPGTNSRIYVVGTIGPPKIIDLDNPLRACGSSQIP